MVLSLVGGTCRGLWSPALRGRSGGPAEMKGGRGHQTRGSSRSSHAEPDFLLQWGSRKRLRCVKIQVKATTAAAEKAADTTTTTTVRVDRRVERSDKENPSAEVLRKASPNQRILRNSEAGAMRSPQRQINGFGHVTSPERGRGGGGGKGGSNGVVADEKNNNKKNGSGGGSSSSLSEGMAAWPKFEIALSNKEKEEDFFLFKGCTKLPQRPKKRAKCIQRTVNLVCPGSWLCDLTQERYEVREKKVSKKRPRGLKAMGSMESDSD